MTGKTTIEWTHMPGFEGAVWNCTTGCTRVSAGCDNCYAFELHDKRYASNLAAAAEWGAGHAGTPQGQGVSRSVLIDFARRNVAVLPWPKQYDLPFSRVQLLEDRLDVPLRTRKPTCYFVDSMSDLFHEDVPAEFIDRVWQTMAEAHWHRFLILTKRPERMSRSLNDHARLRAQYVWPEDVVWPLPNVWLGTSVEDQASFYERVPHLRATPAALRFLSVEPLLGPLDVQYSDWKGDWVMEPSPIQWVIVGGESGPRARPFDLTWARSLRAQCASAHVAFFVKQLGSNPIYTRAEDLSVPSSTLITGEDEAPVWRVNLHEAHGRDMSEWPEDLRVREFPR